jgi:hypothetical protein
MKVNEFLKESRKTWTKSEGVMDNINHAMLGLMEEAGTLAKSYKSKIDPGLEINKDDTVSKVGDILYYLVRLVDELAFEKSDQLIKNLEQISLDKPKFDGEPTELDLVFAVNNRVNGIYAAMVTSEGPLVAKAINDLMFNIKIFTDILGTTPQLIMKAKAEIKEDV